MKITKVCCTSESYIVPPGKYYTFLKVRPGNVKPLFNKAAFYALSQKECIRKKFSLERR